MGISMSKASTAKPQADSYVDETKSDDESTRLSQSIGYWEQTYRERFARKVTVISFRLPNEKPWITYEPLWGLVNKPPAMKFKPETLEFHIKSRLERGDCAPRFVGPTPEPLSADLRARTKRELVHSFNWKMEGYARQEVRSSFHSEWIDSISTTVPHVVPYLDRGDAVPPKLLDKRFLGVRTLSKITAVYFEPGFMRCWAGKFWDDSDNKMKVYYGNGCDYIARAMLAAWEEVHHSYGELPNTQQCRWLAKPTALEGEPGPLVPTEAAIRTHNIICEELEKVQNRSVSSEDPYTWVEHGFEMGPIYRSVIIIVDKQLALKRGEDEAELRDILFERCSALLVRTGDEDHLSAPIDFDTLTAAGLTLPLDRSEKTLVDSAAMQQVVRVRLRTAVRFVMDLERREVIASPRLTARKNVLDADMLREAESWADDVLANAESNGGIDRDLDAWEAVRLAQAHLDGDRCGLERKPFEETLPYVRFW